MRIVAAVHNPPVWTLPASQVRRIAEALPQDEVVDARTPEERRRHFPEADVLLAWRVNSEEALTLTRLKWIQSTAVGVAELMVPEIVSSDIIVTNVRGVHGPSIADTQ